MPVIDIILGSLIIYGIIKGFFKGLFVECGLTFGVNVGGIWSGSL